MVSHSFSARTPELILPQDLQATLRMYITFYASLSSQHHESLLDDAKSCLEETSNAKGMNVLRVLGDFLQASKDTEDDNTLLFRFAVIKSAPHLFSLLVRNCKGGAVEGRKMLGLGGWGEDGGLQKKKQKEIRIALDKAETSLTTTSTTSSTSATSSVTTIAATTTATEAAPSSTSQSAPITPITPITPGPAASLRPLATPEIAQLPPPPSPVTPNITFKKTTIFNALPKSDYLDLFNLLKSSLPTISILQNSMLTLHDDLSRELQKEEGDFTDDDLIDLDVSDKCSELEDYVNKVKDSKAKREKLRDILVACKCSLGGVEGSESSLSSMEKRKILEILAKLRGEVFDAMELEMLPGVEEKRQQAEKSNAEIAKLLGENSAASSAASSATTNDSVGHKSKRQKV